MTHTINPTLRILGLGNQVPVGKGHRKQEVVKGLILKCLLQVYVLNVWFPACAAISRHYGNFSGWDVAGGSRSLGGGPLGPFSCLLPHALFPSQPWNGQLPSILHLQCQDILPMCMEPIITGWTFSNYELRQIRLFLPGSFGHYHAKLTSSVMRSWAAVTVSPNENMTKGKSLLQRELEKTVAL